MDAVEPALRLGLPEHGFAEQVEVEPRPGFADLLDGRPELRRAGVDDEVPDHLAEHLPRDGHHGCRQDLRDAAAEPHRAAHIPGQEFGHDRCDPVQLGCGGAQALRAHHAVDEAECERQAVDVLQHPGQTLRSRVDLDGCRLDRPSAGELDGLLCERDGCRGIRRS